MYRSFIHVHPVNFLVEAIQGLHIIRADYRDTRTTVDHSGPQCV